MNIFRTNRTPKLCARMLDDKRLVKMVLETAQLLSTAINEHGAPADTAYKTTHRNHPCSVWVRKSRRNYDWTLCLFVRLLDEYERRYMRTHKCAELRDVLIYHRSLLPAGPMSPSPLCMPDEFKSSCVFASYRAYMRSKWRNSHRVAWALRSSEPNWRQT